MDDALSRIRHACELARQLEANLPNIGNQPHSLLNTSQEVVRAFEEAIVVIKSHNPPPPQASTTLFIEEGNPFFFNVLSEQPEVGMLEFNTETEAPLTVAGEGNQVVEGSPGRRRPDGSSSSQRTPKKRKEGVDGYTTRVPAPRTGNMEVTPDDGYTWRKYGQKNILGSRFPRSYYKCTHKSYYGCEAKKQIQKLDDDPYTFEVTYLGKHTCRTSPTPLILPSFFPPFLGNNPEGDSTMVDPMQPPASSMQLPSWIRTELEGSEREFHGGGESSGANAGPSNAPGGRDLDYPVTHLADVMFNSGSSGSSMDAIFSAKNEHWKDDDASLP